MDDQASQEPTANSRQGLGRGASDALQTGLGSVGSATQLSCPAMADVGIITAFVFGIVSFLSPCVLPLLPGYLSLMSGYSVGDLQEGSASSARMFRVTLTFVIGFTVIFVILGAAATSVGGFFLRHQRVALKVAGWMVIGFGLLIVASAYSNSRYLAFLTRERR